MTTIRLRGLYATALTSLFHKDNQDWEIVQPDEEVRACLPNEWRMETPAVVIDDLPDARGVRDAISLTGASAEIQRALQFLQQHLMDIAVLQSASQVGAIYMGLVGLVSHISRRAVVYLGDQRAGLLPLAYEDRDLVLGSYIPVRIEALPTGSDDRPQLSATITVPGRYAVLTPQPVVRISKQITDDNARERLQRLGAAQNTNGWGIIWRTAAQDAEEQLLVEEIQHLIEAARDLRAGIEGATSIGYLYGGETTAQVFLSGHAQAVCDSLRADLLPTLPGHHKYKAIGDVTSTTVDALEKELPPDVLRTRTNVLGVLASINAMQTPIDDTLQLWVRDLSGGQVSHGAYQRVLYDLNAGWVEVRQELRNQDSYPPRFQMDQQPGDYMVTRFQEGQWGYVTHFHGRDGAWKGDYACFTTPVTIFADQIRLVDLQVRIGRSPQQTPALVGMEALQDMQQQGRVSAALVQKVAAEGAALAQQWQDAASATT